MTAENADDAVANGTTTAIRLPLLGGDAVVGPGAGALARVELLSCGFTDSHTAGVCITLCQTSAQP